MNPFILQTLRKFDKITHEQARDIFAYTIEEIDRLETVLNSINIGILVCDSAHKLLLTNQFARRILRVRAYEHGSDPVWLVTHDDGVAEFLKTALRSGDRIEGREFEIETRSSTRRLLSFDVLPLVKLYQVTGTVILVEDITKKRAREAKLHRIETLASLTTLAAGVAHEIKNPLASISIHIQLVSKTFEKIRQENMAIAAMLPFDKLTNHLDIVSEEIERLNHIVVDFLFAVRPMDLTLRKGNMNELIYGIVKFIGPELEQRHIACVLDLSDKLPHFQFDERYIKEALLNLIKNAIEAMREKKDGGTLSIKTEHNDADVIITIADTGSGISKKHLSKIFEPYWTTKETGTGLGLTLVFKIIREHRGEITVRSEPGKGTSFIITLPMPQTEQRLLDCNT
ncbi:MAG: GHKL domain-containing protein [Spirochaetaceae bacterium]|jgi:signal transduction histidine kinase|nr:GHKL domain-containing protein [Spirochaetaceae bacterium]